MGIEITYFVWTKRADLLHLKWNSDRLVIFLKGLLKLLNLLMLIKQKRILLPRNLALVTFNKLLRLFSAKVNLSHLRDLMWCCLLLNCWQIALIRTRILMTQVSPYQLFLCGLTWNCIIFMSKLVKEVIINLCQRLLVLIVFRWWIWSVSVNFHTY